MGPLGHRTSPNVWEVQYVTDGPFLDITDSYFTYDMKGVIGNGTFGRVVQAEATPRPHRSGDGFGARPVVIKIFSREILAQDEHRTKWEDMRKEMRICRKITESESESTFLLGCTSTFKDAYNEYIVTELCHGTLEDVMHLNGRKSRLTDGQILLYARELVLAIREMHDVGIVHMDLKPSNILINKHGHLIVCHFGLSHEVPTHIPKHDYPEYLYRDNFSGQIGTIAYTAPEVTNHKFYNCKVDSWSLGMILLEMYMGDKFPRELREAENFEEGYRFLYQWRLLDDVMRYVTDPKAQYLVLALLEENPDKRPHLNELTMHPYFRGIDWINVEARKQLGPVCLPPPIIRMNSWTALRFRVPEDSKEWSCDITELFKNMNRYDCNESVLQSFCTLPSRR